MFGLILVILGILFLLEEMGIIHGDFWGYFWPVILIVLGLNLMKKDKFSMDCCNFWGQSKKKDNTTHKVVDEQ
ncbi:MAG: hypothetical protein A2406_01110 [Candidatus Komeilibacteria bacterium RIFOXYC1_FULL_37_11]|uniref:LiaI-LiaF-like transmembrane region domain-containing protein n=1 Tax=Candidatus Komeilibacteria bacterium RIFOXYC1_FULL_37_11 TaxID=1798555 RepID=A0A1G2BWU5_9BACT|nr:MAG: hypothetical protein A2406_01110 [Candidatus Komeilibacteria bacterium RIFOXYC1_FULL_37_11]OGY95784.1 MAG: hypothetical protein A2611_03350 [Candidatus Komeilibacteria bacterium RIFOXYD1_FULL_37_29]